jgi:polysaccharide biosynthesis transport protein
VQQDSDALNLEQALGVLRRRAPLIALCVVIVAAAAYGFSKHEIKKYKATASLAFSDNPLSQQIAGLPGSGPTNSSELLAQESSNVELVKGGNTAAKTASLLGRGLTEQEVASSLSVAGQGESDVVDVSATSTSPALAVEIANTYTSQFVKEQRSANRQYFKSALVLVRKQLAALSPEQRIGPDGLNLQDRAQTLSLLAELKEGNVDVAAEARPPASLSSPKTSKNTVLGAFLGLLIGLGLAFVLERLDHRIREPKELETIYRRPMLGGVPKSAALSRAGRGKGRKRAVLPSVEAEAFSLIRAHLRFFNVDRDLRTLVIASASPGDGKTTIARHLAEAASRMGSHVLLMEVDLRRPTLAQQLNIASGPGLTDVLVGALSLDEATQSVDLLAPSGDGVSGQELSVLTSGTVPPNPGELLESNAMHALLERARSVYDLVIIDTPPLTAVSDAFPLLTHVDGVVIVGWIGRSRRDVAEGLHQILDSSDTPVLGVIANGSKSSDPSYYADSRSGRGTPTAVLANDASSSQGFVSPAKF